MYRLKQTDAQDLSFLQYFGYDSLSAAQDGNKHAREWNLIVVCRVQNALDLRHELFLARVKLALLLCLKHNIRKSDRSSSRAIHNLDA